MNHAYKIVSLVSQRLSWVAGFALLLMILLTCVDVILRVFGHGILGAYELIKFLVAVMVGFSLAYTQLKRGHISIDLILLRFPKHIQEIIGTVNTLLTTGFYALLTWQLGKMAGKLWRVGQVCEQIELPVFPFVYAVAFGSAMIFLLLLIEFLQIFKKEG